MGAFRMFHGASKGVSKVPVLAVVAGVTFLAACTSYRCPVSFYEVEGWIEGGLAPGDRLEIVAEVDRDPLVLELILDEKMLSVTLPGEFYREVEHSGDLLHSERIWIRSDHESSLPVSELEIESGEFFRVRWPYPAMQFRVGRLRRCPSKPKNVQLRLFREGWKEAEVTVPLTGFAKGDFFRVRERLMLLRRR